MIRQVVCSKEAVSLDSHHKILIHTSTDVRSRDTCNESYMQLVFTRIAPITHKLLFTGSGYCGWRVTTQRTFTGYIEDTEHRTDGEGTYLTGPNEPSKVQGRGAGNFCILPKKQFGKICGTNIFTFSRLHFTTCNGSFSQHSTFVQKN